MSDEIIRIDEDDGPGDQPEEGVEIPLERVAPQTLHRMLTEFVTRGWTDGDCPLEDRIEQVRRQLRDGRARIVYDFRTESWDIVERR